MVVVISVGGSLLNPGKPDTGYSKKLSAVLTRSKERVAIVSGGGTTAREYATAIRALGGGEFLADEAAILATYQNASLLLAALGQAAYRGVVKDFDEALAAAGSGKIVVMGGTIPGITTDTDAVLLAEKLGAVRLVNLSNVDAIYSEDPRKNPRAKRFAKMSHAQLVELAARSDSRAAGTNFVFDLVACKMAARSKMELHFLNGKDFSGIAAALGGKPHSGTVVK